ncbi:MAG: tautomerase family protein [Candidatus Velthaea sp.]
MPLVRIDLVAGKPDEYARTIGEVVYQAMVDVANVPVDDKFQIITRHPAPELVYPKSYLGIEYSPDIVYISVTWVAGRSIEIKQAFYRRIADELHARIGIRKQDVFIGLVDVKREDWSFGNGEMQYGPAPT